MTELPDLPSALLTLALSDLKKAEADPRYVVRMGEWHLPNEDGECEVCLAGAVIAFSLGALPTEISDPWRAAGLDVPFPREPHPIFRQLMALDRFRKGDVVQALELLGFRNPGLKSRDHEYYLTSRTLWHRQMNRLVTELKKAGL